MIQFEVTYCLKSMQSKPGNTLVAAPNKQPIEAESERMKLANIKSICTL